MSELHRNDDGTLDELIAKDARVHLEQMDDDSWCLIVGDADGHTMLYLYSRRVPWWRRWLSGRRSRDATEVLANVIDENYRNRKVEP